MNGPTPAGKPGLTPAMRFASMGLELVAAIGGMFLVGVGADWLFGVSPWGKIVGVTAGAIGGMYNFLRTALSETRRSNAEFQREHHRFTRHDEPPETPDA